MAARWRAGEVIVRREISWGQPCLATPVYVVEDHDDLLVTYLPSGSPLVYAADVAWPTPTGRHPWWPRAAWEGHGVLMLQRPGEAHAVWHFWEGDDRDFRCWYVNLQDPFRRTEIGYDTEDHELDIVVAPTGEWVLKDDEALRERVREGRYPAGQEDAIRAEAERVGAMVTAGAPWWSPEWRDWTPHPSWVTPPAPADGWADVPW